ncbi:CLUMA_CG003418, isoform A [Clunio marinus]|uniref:Dynein axonemal intermediate chain 4 n=1 Tax=Clunio marinus TaxID=568069 RepID=A0A1J1HPG2_9DIPT|nr:CLUMA_CG003418, isoform A [Clunio marinus]
MQTRKTHIKSVVKRFSEAVDLRKSQVNSFVTPVSSEASLSSSANQEINLKLKNSNDKQEKSNETEVLSFDYNDQLRQQLQHRKAAKIIYRNRDATPATLTCEDNLNQGDCKNINPRFNSNIQDLFKNLKPPKIERKSFELENQDLDEISNQLEEAFALDLQTFSKKSIIEKNEVKKKENKFMTARLTEVEFDVYEDVSLIVPKGTKEAERVEQQNARMHYLTTGLGKQRPKGQAFTQTENLKSMILQRLLAENNFRPQQKKIFNMKSTTKNENSSNLNFLWCYKSEETNGKHVVAMCLCPANLNILAVAYGVYYLTDDVDRSSGDVLIWNCKNPVNPERSYRFKESVTAVEFSHKNPQLLAVGLYSGVVEVIDITENNPNENSPSIAKSERKSSPGVEPVWKFEWVPNEDNEFILSVSQDGRAMKYELSSGPYLTGYKLAYLDRVEGEVLGLSNKHKKEFVEANQHPQALCLKMIPMTDDMYMIGTDEGCIHIYSTKLPNQQIEMFQAHQGVVSVIDFSPFSPKIFLSSGSDCMIRIWIMNIYQPIFELSCDYDAVNSAYWSPIDSTIIASCTHRSINIWDLRQKDLKPIITQTFDDEQLTIIKLSSSGNSLIVGDDTGKCHVYSLDKFSSSTSYQDQFEELESSIYRIIGNNADLQIKMDKIGSLKY